jgi:hypothetical protein
VRRGTHQLETLLSDLQVLPARQETTVENRTINTDIIHSDIHTGTGKIREEIAFEDCELCDSNKYTL